MGIAKTPVDSEFALVEKLRPFFLIDNVQYLAGGLSNRCLKLTDVNGQHYVWRPQNNTTRIFGLSRQNEFNALTIAAQQQLSSPPVMCFDDGLLNAWVDGEQLNPLDADVETISVLLAKVHGLPPLTNLFCPFQKAEHYFSQLSALSKSQDVIKMHHYFQRNAFISTLDLTTTHFDLGYYNLIKPPNGQIQIIDWEYAGLGDPALDLVMTSNANAIPLMLLIEKYCQICGFKNPQQWYLIARRWQPIADFLGVLWYLLGYQIYGENFYHEQADMLLKRCKSGVNESSNANELS